MSHLPKALLLTAVLALGATACGSDDAASPVTPLATAPPASATADTTAVTTPGTTAGTTPATTPVTDVAGTEPATIPSKIISLYPTGTEMIYAIGAGDQVMAVDELSDYPAEAASKKTDLSGFTPNVEAIARMSPDLVLIDGTSPDLQPQLEALGIQVWAGPAPSDFDGIYTELEQLGALTGHVADAAAVVSGMQTDIAAAVATVPELSTSPTYYHELDPTFYSATSDTFIGQVYGLFHLRNIADGVDATTQYPQLSAEYIISQSPDLIFLADATCCGTSPTEVASRPGWNVITAVSTDNVITIDDSVASRWGPRVVEYVQAVAVAVAHVAALSNG